MNVHWQWNKDQSTFRVLVLVHARSNHWLVVVLQFLLCALNELNDAKCKSMELTLISKLFALVDSLPGDTYDQYTDATCRQSVAGGDGQVIVGGAIARTHAAATPAVAHTFFYLRLRHLLHVIVGVQRVEGVKSPSHLFATQCSCIVLDVVLSNTSAHAFVPLA